MAGERWSYDQEPKSLEQAVQIAVGGASACWEHLEGAGVFQDDRALEVSQALIEWVEANYTRKVRSYASLDELIDAATADD